MPRDIPIGNGRLLITFDSDYCLRDIYYPHVGKENHTEGHKFRFGIWCEGNFEWIKENGWNLSMKYSHESLVTEVTASHDELAVSLLINDIVDYTEDIYIKKVIVRNILDREREFRLFFHHDFHLLGSALGDTAYYDPDEDAIIHYKGERYFLISGMRRHTQGIDQFATGTKEFRGLHGTWKDAEDGDLQGNPIAQGSVDSTISFHIKVPPGTDACIYYWITAGKTYSDVSHLNQLVSNKGPDALLDRTASYWNAWVNKEDFNLANLPVEVIDLYKKSLLILRTNIDSGGAIIAGNDSDIHHFARDTYSYMWPRDGALTAYALDLAGYLGLTRNFFSFCASIISSGRTCKESKGFFLHKYNPDGSLGSSWHPWLSEGEKILPIQEDGTGLILWSLWLHFDKYRDIEFSVTHYDTMIIRCGDFLAEYRDKQTGLPLPSYDLWEEQWGIHTFTASAVYAGLTAAGRFAGFFGDTQKAKLYTLASEEVRDGMLKYLYDKKSEKFLKTIIPRGDGSFDQDTSVDASIYAPFYFGVLPPRDEKIMKTMNALKHRLWLDTDTGGIARYEGDSYHQISQDVRQIPGNPWVICTLWLAQWHIAKAESLDELQEAIPVLKWAASTALPSGVLAEQVHPFTKQPLSVSPLTWSHATFVATVLEYLNKLEELYICPRCGRPMYRHDRKGREQHRGKEWRKIHMQQEKELGHLLTYVTEGEVSHGGSKARIKIHHSSCVGATMCAFSCPVDVFELVGDKSHIVKENLSRCLLKSCMKCRDNCPTHSVRITFHE
jgi:GH15 family glucan-1,4-alpha-glucosidase/NAD-dependent dihydropyrimidine dehydrogenase PreA subunit